MDDTRDTSESHAFYHGDCRRDEYYSRAESAAHYPTWGKFETRGRSNLFGPFERLGSTRSSRMGSGEVCDVHVPRLSLFDTATATATAALLRIPLINPGNRFRDRACIERIRWRDYIAAETVIPWKAAASPTHSARIASSAEPISHDSPRPDRPHRPALPRSRSSRFWRIGSF